MKQVGYSVNLPVFSGPLDLLLRLIERNELDITTVSLVDVTDQYVQHISGMTERRVEGLAEFLVMAARLLLIKSQALLPRALVPVPDEYDTASALAEQLKTYRMYKLAAQALNERQDQGARTFLRIAGPRPVRSEVDLSDVSVGDLSTLFSIALKRPTRKMNAVSDVVGRPRFSVRQRVREIARALRDGIRTSFFGLLGSGRRTRGEIIATFLAILELKRRNMVRAVQEHAFGDIVVVREGEWNEADVSAIEADLYSSVSDRL